ncbi:MAG: NAD(+) diphosphatase [Rhodospirillaceae bacterium]|nr:NAD(+) diphosphatase [Rhodospirillaceae bacterium]
MTPFRMTYAGVPLDRASHIRADAGQVAALLAGGRAMLLPVWNQRHLFGDDTAASGPRAGVIPFADLDRRLIRAEAPPVFLGMQGDVPWFALGLPDSELPPDLGIAGEFRMLNEVVSLLAADEAAMVAYARAMVIWHGNHLHCGRCGAPTESMEGGHSRQCLNPKCSHRAFPRTDPAVITLIEDPAGKCCLMGRQSKWPPGMYSVIAGFVEPGESLEETVIRETFEETGVRVGAVRYMASQPWPFPATIMLGFHARALTTEINLTDNELEDCRWFTRNDLRSFGNPDGPYPNTRLPNPFSIARFLVNTWLAEG